MDQTLFALPIRPGQGGRRAQYAASERRLGLTKEVWAIQSTPQGHQFVVYFAGRDIGTAFGQFAASRDPFDEWFKERVRGTTGVNLDTPPPGPLSEVLSDYQAVGA